MRQTSIDAYRKIKELNLLSKRRLEAYEILFEHGPLTAGEVFQRSNGGVVKGSVCARITELHRLGVVKECGIKTCALTKMSATLWDVTDNLPAREMKDTRPSNKKIIKELQERVAALEKQNYELRQYIRRSRGNGGSNEMHQQQLSFEV